MFVVSRVSCRPSAGALGERAACRTHVSVALRGDVCACEPSIKGRSRAHTTTLFLADARRRGRYIPPHNAYGVGVGAPPEHRIKASRVWRLRYAQTFTVHFVQRRVVVVVLVASGTGAGRRVRVKTNKLTHTHTHSSSLFAYNERTKSKLVSAALCARVVLGRAHNTRAYWWRRLGGGGGGWRHRYPSVSLASGSSSSSSKIQRHFDERANSRDRETIALLGPFDCRQSQL